MLARPLLLRRALSSAAHPPASSGGYAMLPSVSDRVVRFVLVDYAGRAREFAGREGQRLVDAARLFGGSPIEDDSLGGGLPANRVRSDRWVEDQFGEGPVSGIPHVVLSRDVWSRLAPPGEKEAAVLRGLADTTPFSRLATEVVLSKDLEGAIIHVPDCAPVDDLM